MKIYFSTYWNDYLFESFNKVGWPLYYRFYHDEWVTITPIDLEFVVEIK